MRFLKFTLLFLILATMTLSAIQYHFDIVAETPLQGFFPQVERPDLKYFTWTRWFSQDFQEVYATRLNEYTGLRNTLIRIHNQYDYSFFGQTHAQGFLEGRNRYLYEEDYIREYNGDYFIGKKSIDQKLSRLKNVRDSLAYYHIPLILVFESGKASIFPEYIPSRFHPKNRKQSNYDYFTERATQIGLPFLDINPFFLKIKDTCRYPLFPRYGMHWSMYGVHLVADTIARYVAGASGVKMPEFKVHHLHLSGNSLGSDYDIGKMLNLVFPLRSTPGAYPVVSFNAIPDGKMPAMVIADSYYIQLIETYGKKMFGLQDYYYYNSSLYPHQNDFPPVRADKSNFREKLLNHKVLLVMVSEINLHCAFWGFADEAFRAFHPEILDCKQDSIENVIRSERDWFRFMVMKSKELHRPIDEIIRENAQYSFLSSYSNLPGKTSRDTIQYIRLGIWSNSDWLANVKEKAKKWNIPVDSVMLLDAINSYEQSKKKQ
ncbi:MAG: alginate O-acetyltransferase AlgX-related protein [Bacteroidales bacterium]